MLVRPTSGSSKIDAALTLWLSDCDRLLIMEHIATMEEY